MKNDCLNCGKTIVGRIDKKYCDSYCKSAFQYEQKKGNENSLFRTIDLQLKLNRRLLKEFNKSGKSYVREKDMNARGFNKKYFTHYWKTNKGEVYLFCYEYGFLSKLENGKKKFVLVTWQDYME